jgi:hypothetical protein
MKKILINYAHGRFYGSQKKNTQSGMSAGGFDKVFEYRYEQLDEHFKERNQHILSQPRGAGYWIWKPQIILQTMDMCFPDDYIFYSDSGAIFIRNISPLLPLCDANDGVLLFHLTPDDANQELLQTKRDALILMNCDREDIIHLWPIHAGFQLYKNTAFARYFVSKYLHYCEDERIVTDSPNQFGENYSLFQNHRHDQSVLSCLQKKLGVPSHIDITQYGNEFRKPTDGYVQIINHTRDQN